MNPARCGDITTFSMYRKSLCVEGQLSDSPRFGAFHQTSAAKPPICPDLSASYRASSKKTKDLIHARLNEGFTVEDFRTVIYRKGKQWMNDPKMCKFLRPETLFSNKFEGYLNEKDASQSSISRWEVDF